MNLRSMYLKLKTSFRNRNSYVPELIKDFVLFKAESKSHVSIWYGINITKWIVKGSV